MIGKQKKPIKQAKAPKKSASDSYTFSDHIRELRRRVLWVALVFVCASALAYNYHDLIVKIVMAPLGGEKLVYLTPGGGFNFIFQITMYAGLIAVGPVLMHQIYGFLRPALPPHARKNALKIAFFATALMIAGVGYGYFVAVPSALNFLSTFAGTDIIPNLTADSYLNFFLAYTGGLALLFQLPLLLIFWHWIKPMKPGGLLKSERYVILLAFIVAALITPTPDVVNQAMIAVPLIAIYQLGVVTVLVTTLRQGGQRKPVHASSPPAAHASPVHKTITPTTSPVFAENSPLPRPMRRSVDGFGRRQSKPLSPIQPGVRPLTVPARQQGQGAQLIRPSRVGIDGISSL